MYSASSPSQQGPFVSGPLGQGHFHRGIFKANAEENVPNRFELFLLGEGEKKITEEPDTRKFTFAYHKYGFRKADQHDSLITGIPNTSLFKINKEDHTLGNMLRGQLLHSPHVLFSGYRVPHPMFA